MRWSIGYGIGAEAAPSARLLHFHHVTEIVIFGAVGGRFLCDGRVFTLAPQTAIVVPSMRYHDFDLDVGARDWTLIQVDPYIVDRLSQTGIIHAPTTAFQVRLDADVAVRMEGLCAWLGETAKTNPADPIIEQLTGLILSTLCRLPRIGGDPDDPQSTHIARFLPVIDRLRHDPGATLTLREAAVMCHLSPAYFSRRFAEIFGCGFADYVVSYRLHLAARRVATTAEPFAQIGYALGFSSPSHFTARFRDRFGVTPRDYRRSI